MFAASRQLSPIWCKYKQRDVKLLKTSMRTAWGRCQREKRGGKKTNRWQSELVLFVPDLRVTAWHRQSNTNLQQGEKKIIKYYGRVHFQTLFVMQTYWDLIRQLLGKKGNPNLLDGKELYYFLGTFFFPKTEW